MKEGRELCDIYYVFIFLKKGESYEEDRLGRWFDRVSVKIYKEFSYEKMRIKRVIYGWK